MNLVCRRVVTILATCYASIANFRNIYKQRNLTSNLNSYCQLATETVYYLINRHHSRQSLNGPVKFIKFLSKISQEGIKDHSVDEHHIPDLYSFIAYHKISKKPALPQVDGVYLTNVNTFTPPQSPNYTQLNECGDSVYSTSHMAYDRVHYQSRRQMATSTTKKRQTHTASGDEVYGDRKSVLRFAMTTSSAVDENKPVTDKYNSFLLALCLVMQDISKRKQVPS